MAAPMSRPHTDDWFSYQAEKTGPKPSYKRPMPVQHRAPAAPEPAPEPESQGMVVEESTAGDTIVERVRRFWLPK